MARNYFVDSKIIEKAFSRKLLVAAKMISLEQENVISKNLDLTISKIQKKVIFSRHRKYDKLVNYVSVSMSPVTSQTLLCNDKIH